MAVTYDPLKPVLLGTFGSESDRAALLRLPNGRMRTVGIGDDVGGDRVVAIAENSIVVDHGGTARRILMPGA